MDKLELDDRLAHLEQRVSMLTALVLASLLLIGVFGLLQLIGRTSGTVNPPQAAAPAISTPSLPSPEETASPVPPVVR